MPSVKSDARWESAVPLTVGLWLFVLLVYLPVLVARHSVDGWMGVILDGSTIVVSVALGILLFAAFRATLDWPSRVRGPVLILALFGIVFLQLSFDLFYIAWVSQNFESSWQNLIHLSGGIYEKAFRYMLVYSVNLGMFQLSFVRRSQLRQERQLAGVRSTAQQAQLQALRYQLNPHFLFNTLNSISSLIVTGRNQDAEEMTNRLSSFLRTSLTCDPTGLVPLDEELALIEEYLEVEGVRFGDRLDVSIECDPGACRALIPSFLVQPLVENAIKHGVAPSREPVTIRIHGTLEDDKLCITVENAFVPRSDRVETAGTGVGLANVRQRLRTVFGTAASLTTEQDESGYRAIICIPGVQSQP